MVSWSYQGFRSGAGHRTIYFVLLAEGWKKAAGFHSSFCTCTPSSINPPGHVRNERTNKPLYPWTNHRELLYRHSYVHWIFNNRVGVFTCSGDHRLLYEYRTLFGTCHCHNSGTDYCDGNFSFNAAEAYYRMDSRSIDRREIHFAAKLHTCSNGSKCGLICMIPIRKAMIQWQQKQQKRLNLQEYCPQENKVSNLACYSVNNLYGGMMHIFNILVVEDDPSLRTLFCTVLSKNGFVYFEAEDGTEALAILEKQYIDLMISDIMMPNIDGYELVRIMRENGYNLPVLMITAKDTFEDMQNGFRAGTDDYMIKPVNVNEMILRVSALLRRARIVNDKKLQFEDMELYYDDLTVSLNGESMVIPQKEFYLLYKLLSNPNRVFTKQQLMDEIWGMDTVSSQHTLDVHISRIRERFKENMPFEIKTIRGLGFKAVKKNG
ncbi:Heme response regulator HssR [compost metagenome]